MLFFELLSLCKQLSTANQHDTEPGKKYRKGEQVVLPMSDVGFDIYKTGMMIGINSKNCDVKI